MAKAIGKTPNWAIVDLHLNASNFETLQGSTLLQFFGNPAPPANAAGGCAWVRDDALLDNIDEDVLQALPAELRQEVLAALKNAKTRKSKQTKQKPIAAFFQPR